MLDPKAPASAKERSKSDRARDAADRYARMSGEEKCVFAGALMRRTWYSGVMMPERYDELTLKRKTARHPQQVPPWLVDPEHRDSVRTWILMGGRGSGKTRTYNGWVIPECLERVKLRAGFLGPDFKVSVGVSILGRSGVKTIIDAFDPSLIWKWDAVKNVLTFANGSEIHCLSSEYPKSIEGPEFHLYVVDEVAELLGQGGDNCVWKKRAEPGIRLLGDNGEPVRKIIAGTPEATPLIKDFWEKTEAFPDRYHWTQLATRDNIANLDQENVEQIYAEAGDSMFAKMKLEGHLILESPHALLGAADLAAIKLQPGDERHRTPAQMDRMILAIDANHSEDKKSDECGIIVMGRRPRGDDHRIVHVFADASTGGGPKVWGLKIIEALTAYPEIDELVVEDDKSLVIDVVVRVLRDALQDIGRPIKVTPIQHGNRSKKQRADPVAVEYQLKHVLHDPDGRMDGWDLSLLEWQWSSWNPKDSKAKSPDRVDADVYGVTALVLSERAGDSWHQP